MRTARRSAAGLSIEPAIANFRALAEIAEEVRKQKALEASTAHRRVGILVASLDDIEMRHWAKGRLEAVHEGPAARQHASGRASRRCPPGSRPWLPWRGRSGRP